MHQMALALVAKGNTRSKPAFEVMPVFAEEVEDYHVVPGAGIEPARLAPRDFKSDVINS